MMIYCLAKYPDVYEKLKKEIDENIESLETVEYETLKSKLPYSSAFLNEVLRHYPPLPAIAARRTNQSFKSCGIDF